ncbi:DUF4382 domain-containing protein [uncultured Psychroserpens sp.]|uniref:DUF4382 domain-containing protein n=1 Tax=uncultured Psychroserpens sp. TaxID=255436 RepID=UPI002628BF27|nr:DUF4382 domain-containing protein [uncultured Psychroserpens sp.]
MKFFSLHKTALYSIIFVFFLSSCSKEYETETFENSSLISVKLQGTQSVLSRANITILDVQFQILEDENNPNAWLSLNTINTGNHDLVNITGNDVVTLVDFEEIPTGFIYSIKLVLGDENSIVKNGVEYTLDMAQDCDYQSTNIVAKQLETNKLYDFLIEFDIDGSVEFLSQGTVLLDPKMNTLLRRFELF